jgi:hypothetical protein
MRRPDYAQFSKYHTEVRKIPERHLMPAPLTEAQLDDFLDQHGDRYEVRWAQDSLVGAP